MKRLIVLACLTSFISARAQNVGIGTTTPSEKLDVNGNVKISGLINLNGNTGTMGQVITSQGANPPIWANPGVKSIDYNPIQYSEASPDLFTGDLILKSSSVADKWYDGVGLVSFRDTLFVFGGWYASGSTSTVTNQIRYSVDDGATWVLSNSVLPFSGHTFVYFKSPDGWLYLIGADNFTIQNVETVWRTKDMQNFSVMTTASGWGSRSLMGGWADENGNIYIAGGQTSTNVATGPNDIWRSADGGATWAKIVDSINVNGEYFLGQNISNQVKYFNRRVYVVGGGIAAASPDNTYSKKVFSASIDDLSNWRKENDLPYTNGRRYISVEVWDGKLWAWSGNNAAEGNVKTMCYMDGSGAWHDFKYTYINNNPGLPISTTHAAGITVHKDMLYRVLGNLNNDAYALRRSSFIANMNIRDTVNTKNLFISSAVGSGVRVSTISPAGEVTASNILASDVLTITGLANKAISNQITSAQAGANLWISGRAIFGGGTDQGKTFQVTGDSYVSGLSGIGTASPSTYLAGIAGLAVYNPTNAGISFANANKYWITWINNNDLKFFEGGPGINRLTLKAGGVVNIDNLSGSGTRMVVADPAGNLATQIVPATGEVNTASNLGNTTFGFFRQKVGPDLQFRSISTPVDGGIALTSNTNDIEVKNNSFEAYGKVEAVTGDATPDVLIKTITPAYSSAGTLEVDIAGVSNTYAATSGKKYARYRKIGSTITILSVTDIASEISDSELSTVGWTITGGSGDIQIKVTGTAGEIIKWRAIYKLNQVTVGP